MSKRTSLDIKKRILELLKLGYLTYAQLERKTNTGFNTIKSNCSELELYGFIKIEKKEKHPKSGRPFFQLKITEKGIEFIKKI